MSRVDFYHLQNQKLEDVLPKLLEKAYSIHKNAVVRVGNAERIEFLNSLLWTYDEQSFLPHGSKKDGMPEKAHEIMDMLKQDFKVQYDEKDAIGKRYRRQDAIGTPYCITVDTQTLEDNTVTVRERDTMEQIRIGIDKLSGFIHENIKPLAL